MSNPYTTQTISGYNSSPPPDDGTQVSTNEIKWSNHKTKLGDPIKTLSEAINTELLSAFGKIFGQNVSSHSGDYTVVAGDQGKFLDVTGTTTITLLAAATAGASFALAIVNNGTGVVTVDGNGAETINGSATIPLYAGESIILTCNGTLWIGASLKKLEDKKGADIASATTTDIGAAIGEFVDITGTTTITGLGTANEGIRRTVQFDGSLTLTYNATSLILPGNADIVTQAGDVAEFISLGSGNWLCIDYQQDFYSPIEGGIVQVVEGTPYTTYTSTSTSINVDDSIPQNTEGTEYITADITPKSTTNRLRITATADVISNASNNTVIALFQDTTAGALAVSITPPGVSETSMHLVHEMEAGTTSSTTFKIRIGPEGAEILYINGNSSNRLFGGLSAVRLRIEEIAA